MHLISEVITNNITKTTLKNVRFILITKSFQLIVRLLPGRVQLLLLDFIDTGIDVNYDEVELPLVED